MKHYNIIGDIHGRTCWKRLVKDDCVNIFVGDYFDPYEKISFAELLYNFNDLIAYKQLHPETVLLYGNHDLHYISSADRSSRYNHLPAQEICKAFDDNKNLFYGVAYSIEGHTLVTHAGVTKEWYEKMFGTYNGESPEIVANNINSLWQQDKTQFSFRANSDNPYDIYGEAPTHSPLWIRPWVLAKHNLFAQTPYKQVFGHTQVRDIATIGNNLTCVDCLGTVEKALYL